MVLLYIDLSRNLSWITFNEGSSGLLRISQYSVTGLCSHSWVICISHGRTACILRGLVVLCVVSEHQSPQECPDYSDKVQWFEIQWRWGKMNSWVAVFLGSLYRHLEKDILCHYFLPVPMLNPKKTPKCPGFKHRKENLGLLKNYSAGALWEGSHRSRLTKHWDIPPFKN